MNAKMCAQEFKLECEIRHLTKRTVKNYSQNVERFLVFAERELAVKNLEEIRATHIKQYMRYLMHKGLTPSYCNGIMKSLRAFFKFAVQEEYLEVSPAEKVSWQKEGKVLIDAFADEEVTAMLKVYGNSSFLSARNKLILAIAFDTGARNTEICSIMPKDIQGERMLIHGKGNKERNVPLTPYVRRMMLKYDCWRSEYFKDKVLQYDNYLLSRTGRPLTCEAVEHVFTEAGKRAQIRTTLRCSPHTARHYYAQANLRNGLDVYSLSRLLGHENINITKRYLQSLQDSSIVELASKSSPLSRLKL